MSRPFSPPDTRAVSRWSGPAIAALGLIVIGATAATAGRSPLARWTVIETLAPANVLPLVALGAAVALISARGMVVAFGFFVLGMGSGLFAEDALLRLLDKIPGSATHLFLTGPMSYLSAGAALVVSTRWRTFVAPPAAAVSGAMVGLTIMISDPSSHDPAYTWTPVLIALWTVLAVALCLRGFWREWFLVFGRILGSWMLAIGLLYGGASLIPQKAPPLPPAATPPTSASGDEGVIPGRPVPEQLIPYPDDEPSRQP